MINGKSASLKAKVELARRRGTPLVMEFKGTMDIWVFRLTSSTCTWRYSLKNIWCRYLCKREGKKELI